MPNALRLHAADQWAPDLAESGPTLYDIDGLRPIASNAYQTSEQSLAVTYASIPSPIPITDNTIPKTPLGSIGFTTFSGKHINVVGTVDDLYFLDSSDDWVSVKPASITRPNGGKGTSYNNITSWEFVKFGDSVIGVSGRYPPVILKAGASKFVELAGSPPRAAHIGVISDFVFLAGIKDHPTRIQWSAFNNPEIWNNDGENQSDYQDLLGGGGPVTKIVSGDLGYVFQESAIRRVEFQGGDIIFAIRNILPGDGTIAPNSVCQQGKFIYYYGLNGFYKIHMEQGTPVPIGAGKVDDFFERDTDKIGLSRMQGEVDFRRSLVWWLYSSKGVRENFNKALLYNFSLDLWSKKENVSATYIGILNPRGYTLDQTGDSVFYPSPGKLDTPGAPSLDDPVLAGDKAFALFTSTGGKHIANLLSGVSQPGSITFRPMVRSDGHRMFTSRVRPRVLLLAPETDTINLTVAYKDSETARRLESNTYTLSDFGEFNPDLEAYYQYFTLHFPNGVREVSGLLTDTIGAGIL